MASRLVSNLLRNYVLPCTSMGLLTISVRQIRELQFDKTSRKRNEEGHHVLFASV